MERASRGCTRVDLPPVKWDVDVTRLQHYIGGAPDRSEGGKAAKYDEPPEDLAEGCPGGWRYARFGYLLSRYGRRRTDTGDRVQSHNFDRIAQENSVLADAVLYFEAEQERCIAFCQRKANEKSLQDLKLRGAGR